MKPDNNYIETEQDIKEQQLVKGSFYFLATSVLLSLILKPHNVQTKGFHRFLYKWEMRYDLFKLLLLARIFKYIDKHWKIKRKEELHNQPSQYAN